MLSKYPYLSMSQIMLHKVQSTVLSLSSHPLGKWTMVWLVLDAYSIWNESTISPHWLILLTIPLGETPLAANMNLKQSFPENIQSCHSVCQIDIKA